MLSGILALLPGADSKKPTDLYFTGRGTIRGVESKPVPYPMLVNGKHKVGIIRISFPLNNPTKSLETSLERDHRAVIHWQGAPATGGSS